MRQNLPQEGPAGENRMAGQEEHEVLCAGVDEACFEKELAANLWGAVYMPSELAGEDSATNQDPFVKYDAVAVDWSGIYRHRHGHHCESLTPCASAN